MNHQHRQCLQNNTCLKPLILSPFLLKKDTIFSKNFMSNHCAFNQSVKNALEITMISRNLLHKTVFVFTHFKANLMLCDEMYLLIQNIFKGSLSQGGTAPGVNHSSCFRQSLLWWKEGWMHLGLKNRLQKMSRSWDSPVKSHYKVGVASPFFVYSKYLGTLLQRQKLNCKKCKKCNTIKD